MKKLIAIASGSFVIAAGLVTPLSSASNLSYHNYLFDRHLKKENQNFSQRKVKASKNKAQSVASLTEKKSLIRNYRYPTKGKRYIYSKDKSEKLGTDRSVSDRTVYFGAERTTSFSTQRRNAWAFDGQRPSRALSTRRYISASKRLETYKNDEYTVQLPKGLVLQEDNVFYDKNRKLAISIKHIKNCEGLGFSACAINTSKNENHVTARDKISNISRIQRQLSIRDSVHNDISVKLPTFNETFEGVYLGQEVFISRYFVADGMGGFYLIDATTDKANSSRELDTMKKVFDSFRII